MFLIDDLLLSPVTAFRFLLSQIQTLADNEIDTEINDDSRIKDQLLELEMRMELDEISSEEYTRRQAELFARLRVIRQQQMSELENFHTADSSSFIVDFGGDDEGEP